MIARLLVAAFALAAIAVALWKIETDAPHPSFERIQIGDTPARIYTGEAGAPSLIVAHGFAGSQQLMIPFARTLAEAGFTVVTFDFYGHGANSKPLTGDVTSEEGAARTLTEQFIRVIDHAEALGDGRIGILGHSMGADLAMRVAVKDSRVGATVAVSMFPSEEWMPKARNLLMVSGEWEGFRSDGALEVLAAQFPEPLEAVTYGDFVDGTARRIVDADATEHISVLYSPEALREARDWFGAAFDRPSDAALAAIGPWIALLIAGVAALAWPLSNRLPLASDVAPAAPLSGWAFWAAAVAPAVLTPLLLWKAPTDFLPALIADYLAAHFAVYGVLTAGVVALLRSPALDVGSSPRLFLAIFAALLASAYAVFGFGGAIDRYFTSFTLHGARWPMFAALLLGTLAYFLATERLARGKGTPRGGLFATRALFLLSLAAAVALNNELFFLAIIVPAIIIFFGLFGLYARWMARATNHWAPGALANAVIFAWAIAAVFPILG